MRTTSPMFFSIGCAALAMRVTAKILRIFVGREERPVRSGLATMSPGRDEVDRQKGAVFSGLHCLALRVRTSKRLDPLIFRDAIAGARRVDPPFIENCIEKNFHVPNMRAGPW